MHPILGGDVQNGPQTQELLQYGPDTRKYIAYTVLKVGLAVIHALIRMAYTAAAMSA